VHDLIPEDFEHLVALFIMLVLARPGELVLGGGKNVKYARGASLL
jgi:hypothetical protein